VFRDRLLASYPPTTAFQSTGIARPSPSSAAFPVIKPGRLLQLFFRGLLSVHSRYGLHARRVAKATLSIEGFSSFVAFTTASIATGWSEPVPGRELHSLESSAFSRRTLSLTIPSETHLEK
jgi:hypothetical protein